MADNPDAIGRDLMNIPLGEMVRSIAMAIAEAQFELDKSSLVMAEFMSGKRVLRDLQTGQLIDAGGNPTDEPTIIDSRVQFGYTVDGEGNRVPRYASWLELGFVPNFYQFVDTVLEVKLALRLSRSSGPDRTTVVMSTPVDAGYAASFNYSAELAAVFKTKLVPVPPPSGLAERLQQLSQEEEGSGQ